MFDNDELIDKLNRISLYGLEKIKIGDVLVVPIEWSNSNENINIFKSLAKLFLRLFFINYKVEKKGSPNALLFFASTHNRKDHRQYFSNFSNLFTNCVIARCDSYKICLKNLKYYHYALKWLSELKKVIPSLKKRLYYICFLLEAFILVDKVKDYLVLLDFVIVYCDFHPIDSFLVQYAKLSSVKTITLQHGNVSSKLLIWIKYSHSDFFFAYNQYTIDEAKKIGCDSNKIYKVGYLQYIGREINCGEPTFDGKLNTVGLFLDGKIHISSNIQMIKDIKKYCSLKRKKLVIRLHPTCKMKDYSILLDRDVIINNNDLNDFINEIDIAIIKDSTVLYDCIAKGKIVLIYNINNVSSYSSSIFSCISINRFDDLLGFECSPKFINDYMKLKSNLLDIHNVSESYVMHLTNLGVKL